MHMLWRIQILTFLYISLFTFNSLSTFNKSSEIFEVYIVILKSEVSILERDQLINNLTGSNDFMTPDQFNIVSLLHNSNFGFVAKLSQIHIEQLKLHPIIDYIQKDHKINMPTLNPNKRDKNRLKRHLEAGIYNKVSTQQCNSVTQYWNIDVLDQQPTNNPTRNNVDMKMRRDNCFQRPQSLTGEGVSVYLMDTGVFYGHDQFEGRVKYPGFDNVDHFFQENRQGADCHSHGTHVAGIIVGRDVGVAPGATIYSVRMLRCDLTSSWGLFLDGIEKIIAHRVNNTLLNTPCIVSASIFSVLTLESRNWIQIIKNSLIDLENAGCSFITVAGNGGENACNFLPSALDFPIRVGGVTPTGTVMKSSNHGNCLDIFAPGKNILSSSLISSTSLTQKSGTSMAAPHVVGVATLILEKCPLIVRQEQLKQLVIKLALKHELILNADQLADETPNLLLNIRNSALFGKCEVDSH